MKRTRWRAAAAAALTMATTAPASQALAGSAVVSVAAGNLVLGVRNDTPELYVGRFNLGNGNGLPYLSLFPQPPATGFTTVRVGGDDTVFGNPQMGAVTAGPAVAGNGIATSWSPNGTNLSVTQNLTLLPYPSGTPINTLRIEYVLANNGSSPVQAGLRVLLHPSLSANGRAMLSLTPGGPPVVSEQQFTGSGIPPAVYAYDTLPSPTRGAEWQPTGNSALDPDALTLADWDGGCLPGPKMRFTLWSYNLCSSPMRWPAIVLYWSPTTIGAGQTRTCTTYFGVAPGMPVAPPSSGGTQTVIRPSKLLAAPNPADERAFVYVPESANPGVSVRVYDVTARLVAQLPVSDGIAVIPTAPLPNGVYVWVLRHVDGKVEKGTFAVRHTAPATR